MRQLQIHPVIIKLLAQKYNSSQEQEEFFSKNLNALPDFNQLKDIDLASNRVISAIESNERIGIYGDYDVDGTTSCATFFHFFKLINYHVNLYQPSRFEEGYGLHKSSIDKALEDGIKVLITVDCGITNVEAAAYAKTKGIDLIITDHHEDGAETMPDAYAIVNPSRRDENPNSPMKNLAGVGVAFVVCKRIREIFEGKGKQYPSIYPLLQFVAIGTISDLAHLNPMNLKLVRHGLIQMPKSKYPGIRQFFTQEEMRNEFVPSEKVSFGIGPMINSKGRLDHAEMALNLLIADDSTMANKLFLELDSCNKERKFIQKQVVDEAKLEIMKDIRSGELISCICYNENWHEGVIGIVASRLVEEYKVPSIVFTNASEEGVIKASARSAGELDLHHCLSECSDLFIKFGGHKAAAGLSMKKENLPIFKERLNKILASIPEIIRTKQDHFDLEIDPEDICPLLAKGLELMEPFGMGNSKPIFKTRGLKLNKYDLMKDIHVRWSFSSKKNPSHNVQGVTFNYIGKYGAKHPKDIYREQETLDGDLSIYYTIGINRFRGMERIQLMVEKVEI